MKSRILAIANIRIAQGSTDVRETTSAYARGQPGWAGGQQMMSTKIMNLSQVVNQGLCETALSAEHERPVSRQHEQMKSRILAIANIRIAQPFYVPCTQHYWS